MSKKRIIDVDQLRDLIEVQKLQHRIVSEITGIPVKKITKYCHRYDIQTQRTGPRSGEGHPEWKGGRILIGGYWYIYKPDHPHATQAHRVAEHRLVMEQKLGRYLEHQEVVHHIDGNSQNNHPDNLVVFQTNAQHLKRELNGRVPNWSPEGYLNMSVNKRKYQGDERERMRQAWRHYDKLRRHKEHGGGQQPLPIDHQTS